MGLFFTLLYIATIYLSPEALFGEDVAQMHVVQIIAAIALIATLFSLPRSGIQKMPQTWGILGLTFAMFCSILVTGWIGGGVTAAIDYSPAAFGFFLAAIHCRKRWHVQAVVVVLFLVAVFVVYKATDALAVADIKSKYVYDQGYEGEHILRIRGMSVLGDPNDFAQFLVALLPCMFLFWKRGGGLRNLVAVYLPAGFLIYGMYLTHSRGGMVALMAAAILTGRRKIGIIGSTIGGVAAFAAMTAAGFSGGRDVSAGEDRVAAWSAGLAMFRTHPIFGVGLGQFGEFYENRITAHNSIVVCAAETGLLGFFCWTLIVFVTLRDANLLSKPAQQDADRKAESPSRFLPGLSVPFGNRLAGATPANGLAGHHPEAMFLANGAPPANRSSATPDASAIGFAPGPSSARLDEQKDAEDAEIRRFAGVLTISIAAYLVAGWFLSRAFSMVLTVQVGMAAAVYRMAILRGIAPPEMPVKLTMKRTLQTCFVLLIIVYAIIRVDHFLPK